MSICTNNIAWLRVKSESYKSGLAIFKIEENLVDVVIANTVITQQWIRNPNKASGAFVGIFTNESNKNEVINAIKAVRI